MNSSTLTLYFTVYEQRAHCCNRWLGVAKCTSKSRDEKDEKTNDLILYSFSSNPPLCLMPPRALSQPSLPALDAAGVGEMSVVLLFPLLSGMLPIQRLASQRESTPRQCLMPVHVPRCAAPARCCEAEKPPASSSPFEGGPSSAGPASTTDEGGQSNARVPRKMSENWSGAGIFADDEPLPLSFLSLIHI